MVARLTDRDVRILAKCAICRWLTTDQIRRLFFPGATSNAVQKRLRKLSDDGYLRSHRAHSTAEAVHAVGPKGKPVVEKKGIEVTIGEEVPRNLEHLLGVNEIRVSVEMSPVPIAFFFVYVQLASLGWKHAIIPDAVFAVKDPGRRTFLIEYDRSTEPLGKLVQKLKSYGMGLSGLPFEALLLVTERTRRLDLLSRELQRKSSNLVILTSTLEEIRAKGFFESQFLVLLGRGHRRVLDVSRAGDA